MYLWFNIYEENLFCSGKDIDNTYIIGMIHNEISRSIIKYLIFDII